MSNPLFNVLSGSFGNTANFLHQLNQFKQTIQGDPKQQVQKMLNEGKITQEQFNQVANMATQIQKVIK